MKQQLPELFVREMKERLGDEFELFMASYDAPRLYGLRSNSLKIDSAKWRQQSPFQLRPVPWCGTGSYYDGEVDRPAKHPYYHAGLYYIQEPSAMAPVELLDVQPGHRVLDLCAAPGGKSTQIAAKLQGTGVLVTNDNATERTKALAKNIELAGVRNAVVLNEEPASLAPVFAGWFDRILIDAPCSGEGMFRKDESMIAAWERHSVERCSTMQRDIMRHAAAMLAPGGVLVYSTCTFSPIENEAQIAKLLVEHPELEPVPVRLAPGFAHGRPDWAGIDWRFTGDADGAGQADENGIASSGMIRLWPHKLDGEGHFAAVIRRKDNAEAALASADDGSAHDNGREVLPAGESRGRRDEPRRETLRISGRQERRDRDERGKQAGGRRGGAASGGALKQRGGKSAPAGGSAGAVSPAESWRSFAADHLIGAEEWQGRLIMYGSRVYLQPEQVPSLDGLRVVRAGWYLGDAGPHRFEPSQPLAMGLKADEAKRKWNGSAGDAAIVRYLKGETVHLNADELTVTDGSANGKGYTLVCVDGFPLGWGKYADGMLKNELPAGWRWV
ncbi:RsmB/NOP family class I SAM-dependent RNA methyltransferase [Paenibacillus kobensis]|uniref:RsmB/NOP family class I SAM-dependent RNA methyltransferase n=1 Tax=Paenibacillus kobensis TaxID=59841 RepID=UPI000FD7BEAB